MKIGFITQNEAPFRLKWMEEIAKYEEVVFFHISEYEKGTNMNYISYRANNIKNKNISKDFFGKKIYDIKQIKQEKCDLFILDGYGFFAQQILIILMWICKKKFIMSIDGGFINPEEGWLKKRIKSFLISRATAYFSTSEETDDFIKYYVGDKAVIYRHLFSSINQEKIRKSIDDNEKNTYREELNISDSFTIIAVGRFIPIKGFDILIDAMEYMNANIQIYFVGASDHSLYESKINERNKNRIHFVDFCDEELLKKYYIASDVFVLPSRGDVWGLVVGEAMSYGLPVLTSNRCLAGVAMIQNGKNGYVFELDNIVELANRINVLAKDIELCKYMGNNNLKQIKEYSIESAVIMDLKNLKGFYDKYGNK